jgi:hypothetical protein
MSDLNLADILTGAHVALKLLSAKLITLIALLMAFGLFSWAMWDPTTPRVIVASIWALGIFLPVLWTGRKGHDHG